MKRATSGRSNSYQRSGSGRDIKAEEEEPDYNPPYHPSDVPKAKNSGTIKQYCQNPLLGRIEWVMAEIRKKDLNKGIELTDEMIDDMEEQEMFADDMEEAALIIPPSIGGRGDHFWNVFVQGRTFLRDTYDDEVESYIYHFLKNSDDDDDYVRVRVKFLFKDDEAKKPYKVLWQVESSSGDLVENESINL